MCEEAGTHELKYLLNIFLYFLYLEKSVKDHLNYIIQCLYFIKYLIGCFTMQLDIFLEKASLKFELLFLNKITAITDKVDVYSINIRDAPTLLAHDLRSNYFG